MNFDFDQTRKFDSVSWTLGLNWQIDPDTLLYAANRRSTRHGGFNYFQQPVPGFGEDGGNAYRTEFITDIEVGLKKQGNFGIPYRFNLAVFQAWIDDAQRVAYTLREGAPVAITVNVPGARVRGPPPVEGLGSRSQEQSRAYLLPPPNSLLRRP